MTFDNAKLRVYMRAVKRNFCPAEDEMVSYYQQRLDPNRIEEIRTHLTDCAECGRMLEEVRDFFIDERPSLPATTIKDDFEKVWNRVTNAQQPPVLGLGSSRSRFELRLSIAASFVLVLIGLSLGLWWQQRRSQQPQQREQSKSVQQPLQDEKGLEASSQQPQQREQPKSVQQPLQDEKGLKASSQQQQYRGLPRAVQQPQQREQPNLDIRAPDLDIPAPDLDIPAPETRVQGPVQLAKVLSEIEVSELILTKVPPVYPPLARQARITGTVRFRLRITRDGSVDNLTLLSGHPLLVGAAMEAVKQWKFQPQKGNVEATVSISFSLTE